MSALTPEQAAAVLAKHEAMCWWLARRVGGGMCHQDIEDLASVIRTQFLIAAETYDPDRGIKFGTYAVQIAGMRARRAARLMKSRGVRVPIAYDVENVPAVADLNEPVGDDGTEVLDFVAAPEPDATVVELPGEVWDRVASVLEGSRLRCVLYHFRDGLSFAEIGRRLGVSKSRVGQLMDSAIRVLRATGAFAAYADAA